MKRSALVGFSFLLVLTLVAAAAAETIRIEGTGATQELLNVLGKNFTAKHPGVRIEVPDSIGTGGGIKAAGEGRCDLGRVSRKPNEKEASYGLEYTPFANLPLVFVAHSSVRVGKLTTAQTADVFGGKITNWSELGGEDMKIRVVSRYEGDSTIKLLRKSLKGWADLQVTQYSKAANTDEENIEIISGTPGAIGFSGLDLALRNKAAIMDLDGVSYKSRGYPLFLEQGIVYKPEKLTGVVKEFVDFLHSPEAAAIITKSGSIPIGR